MIFKPRKLYIVKKTTLLLGIAFLIRGIRKTNHYRLFHEQIFPFSEVSDIILHSKNRRAKGDKIELKNDKYYILFKIKRGTAYVINAKRK
jgi:hypothetical protein